MAEINQVTLSGYIAKLYPAFTTPAGIPVVRMLLEHSSTQIEAMAARQVRCKIFSIWVSGKISAEQLHHQVEVSGFLSLNKNKNLILHINTLKYLD